jgi:predicted choloylglycine hydrolase
MIRLHATGDAWARGAAQGHSGLASGLAADLAAQVRAATVARVETARADGLLDAEATAYLAAQRAFHARHDPDGLAELDGIATGFNLPEADLFAHLHLGTLRDLKGGARLIDGCSAWALTDGPDGPLVVKNRDYSGQHLGIQAVTDHKGPDIVTGGMLCLGSLGSPGAYSSGINAAGLAVADTQVAVATHRVGWLRYFLMTRLLARCSSVADALGLLSGVPHAGGGTLILADAQGAAAAVELGAHAIARVSAARVWRTNHFVSDTLADDTLPPGDDTIAANSRQRLAYLAATLPEGDWTISAARALMATHPAPGGTGAPICQHGTVDATQTISSAVYSCTLRSIEICEGNPCTGDWQRFALSS